MSRRARTTQRYHRSSVKTTRWLHAMGIVILLKREISVRDQNSLLRPNIGMDGTDALIIAAVRRHRNSKLEHATLAAYHTERQANSPSSTQHVLATERRHSLADARAWLEAELVNSQRSCRSRPTHEARIAAAAVMNAPKKNASSPTNHHAVVAASPVRPATVAAALPPPSSLAQEFPGTSTPMTTPPTNIRRHEVRSAAANEYYDDNHQSVRSCLSERTRRVDEWVCRRAMERDRQAAVRTFDAAVERSGGGVAASTAGEELTRRAERGLLGTGHHGDSTIESRTRSHPSLELEAIIARAAALPLDSPSSVLGGGKLLPPATPSPSRHARRVYVQSP